MTVVIAGCWVMSSPAADRIYKWVDTDGSIHYADHPPPEVKDPETLSIAQAPDDAVVRDAEEKRYSLMERQRTDYERRSAKKEQERLKFEAERAERERRRQHCTKAQEEIQNLNHHMPVYYFDEAGKRVFLDDKNRADLLEFYKREQAMYCD